MKIDITPLFQRNGAVLPLEFTEWEDGNSDYLGVVEFVEPVKIEGTLKNENEVFVLEAKGGTEVLLWCDRCLAPVRKELCFEIKGSPLHG